MFITQKLRSVKAVIKTVFLYKENANKKIHKSFVRTGRKNKGFLKAYFSSCSAISEPCKKISIMFMLNKCGREWFHWFSYYN